MKSITDLEERDQAGNTALMRLCKIGQDKKVKVLLDAGAPFTTQNMNGATAVYIAAEHGNEKCVELIIQKENANQEEAKVLQPNLHGHRFSANFLTTFLHIAESWEEGEHCRNEGCFQGLYQFVCQRYSKQRRLHARVHCCRQEPPQGVADLAVQ